MPGWKRLGPWLVLFNLAVVPLSLQGIHSSDSDTFYHLLGGRWMVEHRQILDHEAFSFTVPGTRWTNYSWLFDVVLFAVYSAGGLTGIILFRALLFCSTMNLLLLWIYRRTGRRPLATSVFGLLALALYYPRGLDIRPHLVSYLFLAVSFLLLDRFERRPRALDAWLPLLCVLWASFHGVEYPILLAVVAVYGFTATRPSLTVSVGAAVRDPKVIRWAALFGLSGLAFCASPFGLRVLATPFLAEHMQHIGEMSPYPWRGLFNLFPHLDLRAAVFFNLALAAGLLALPGWVARRELRAPLLALLGAALAFRSVRFFVEFAIIAVPFIAGGVAELRARWPGRAWAINLTLAAFLGYLGLGSGATIWWRYREGAFRQLSATAYPIGPVRLLHAEGLAGNLLTGLSFAGYVEWMLYPRIRISMDMRTPEPFDTQLYWRIQSRGNPPVLASFLDEWPVDFALLDRHESLAGTLRAQPALGFRLIYADDRFVLFARERVLAGGHETLALTALNPADGTLDYVADLVRQGKAAALGADIARLLAVWPANRLAHRTELALRLAAEDYPLARDQALSLARANPRDPSYPYDAGRALRALGQPAAAFAEFEEAIRRDPAFAPAYPALADTAFRLGRYRRGLGVLEAYRAREPDLSARQYLLLGNLRLQTGRRAEAVRAYERALWLSPDASSLRPDIESNLGGLYVDLGEPAKALPLLDAALRRVPPPPEAEFHRARAWATLGRAADARAVFTRLAADDSLPDALRAAARAHLQAGPGLVSRPP